MKTTLIIDCDPGVDDATGLFMAFAASELDLLAVTTVGGNVPASLTARNACILRQIAERPDVPVFAGADRPLVRELAGAGEFHGEEGLGDLEPFETLKGVEVEHAVDALVRLVMERPPQTVSLILMGPMTNLALALRKEPRLATHLKEVVAMGGARSAGGNITASAEFNIWADPDAAHEVMQSAARVVMIGLDVTHDVRVTEERICAVEAIGNASAEACAAMLRFSQRVERTIVGWHSAPLHDPCTVAYVLAPDIFTLKPALIGIETQSDLTRGHTAVEMRVDAATASHQWAAAVDAQRVFDLIIAKLNHAPSGAAR